MDSYKYIELTFYGKHAGIVKKINWCNWHKEVNDTRLLMTSNEKVLFLYDTNDIKHYWKTFRDQEKDSYDPPFPSLCIAIRELTR